MISTVDFSQIPFMKLREFFSVLWLLNAFIMKKTLNFLKCFFCINWNDHVIFPPFIPLMCMALIDFLVLSYPWIPGIDVVSLEFCLYATWFVSIFLWFLHTYSEELLICSFLVSVCLTLIRQGYTSLIEWVEKCSSSFCFWEEFVKTWN